MRGVILCDHTADMTDLELSIVIPAWNEARNLAHLLPLVRRAAAQLGVGHEILLADAGSDDGTVELCRREGVRLLEIAGRGYGRALLAAFAAAKGRYVITMDADLSHPADFIRSLWEQRDRAELLIASRYVAGGRADMPLGRRLMSRLLNWSFRHALHVPARDLSSGFRLYRASLLKGLSTTAEDFNLLQEVLIGAHAKGYRILEVPFHYRRRGSGSSHARLVAFGLQYLRTFGRMWRLRNSIASSDYDARAYDSLIPVQRWWQRRRFRIVTGWLPAGAPVLDIGCGSSRILGALPPGSLGCDPVHGKLRYARRFGAQLAAGALPSLPVRSGAFPAAVCSQVIEHIPGEEGIFQELSRVLAPGGLLILGTPDYGRLAWRCTEALYHRLIPGGYADDHVTRYTRASLEEKLRHAGFDVLEARYIGWGEMILRCRKSREPRAGGGAATRA